ncbi:hypothetical protein ACFXCQ_12040, partial [Streptomyces kronopolitis]
MNLSAQGPAASAPHDTGDEGSRNPSNRKEIFMKLCRALSVSAATAALLPLAMAAAPASQAASAAKLPECSEVSNGQYENNALACFLTGSSGFGADLVVGRSLVCVAAGEDSSH